MAFPFRWHWLGLGSIHATCSPISSHRCQVPPSVCLGTVPQNPRLPTPLPPTRGGEPGGSLTEVAEHRASLAPWHAHSGAHVCASASRRTMPRGRKGSGLRIAPAGAQEGVPREMVAGAGGQLLLQLSGYQPVALWGAQRGVLAGWTPPPARQPIRPQHWHPFEIKAAGLSRQLFL